MSAEAESRDRKGAGMGTQKIQTTLRLPKPLYEQARLFAKRSASTESINDFFVAAIKAYLKTLKRQQIDAAFSAMAEDPDYHKEAVLIAGEFADSDWEAFELHEKG